MHEIHSLLQAAERQNERQEEAADPGVSDDKKAFREWQNEKGLI